MVRSLVELLLISALYSGVWGQLQDQKTFGNEKSPILRNENIALPEDVHTTVVGESTESDGHRGCFKDQQVRDLPHRVYAVRESTIEICRAVCQTAGFRFAGLQYSYACFCGNSFGRYGMADNCNMTCAGNRNQTCGGAYANNVYENPGYVKPIPVGPFQHYGCYRDNQTRDLHYLAYEAPYNTIQQCRAICHRFGFKYAAVQNASLCFCGNSFGRYGKADNCDTKCAGNSNQTCGGAFANNVYVVPSYAELRPEGPFQHYGCYRDNQARDLPHLANETANNTIQQCRDACKNFGFKYAAVQNTSRCFCGNSFGRYGKADNCDTTCAGNSNQTCGGVWASNIFGVSGYVGPELNGELQFFGCFKDDEKFRDLPHLIYDDLIDDLFVKRCKLFCQIRGFRFAGVQGGSKCFCGNSFGRYGKADNCNTKCPGSNVQTCGGHLANSVFSAVYVKPVESKLP